jgi:beta-lactamase superfamily II metal-dependent hydrolase
MSTPTHRRCARCPSGRRRGAALALGLAASAAAPVLAAAHSGAGARGGGPDQVEVVFFDSGDGDCTVVLTPLPDRKVLVFDGGHRDTALQAVLPYLRQRAVEAIDLMVLTHAASGHIEGLRVLLRELPVREVWDPGYRGDGAFEHDAFAAEALAAARAAYHGRLGEQLVASPAADANHAELRQLVLGVPEELGSVGLTLLHTSDSADGPNDRFRLEASAIVLKLAFGDNSILFGAGTGRRPGQPAGDSSAHFTEAALLALERADPGLLRSTVLRAAGHGADTASGAKLLDAVRPEWVVLSCAAGRRAALHPDVLARCAARGANLLRTDRGDDAATPHDDHMLLCMGRRRGELTWRQGDTDQLLAWAAERAAAEEHAGSAETELLLPPRPLGR